MPRAKKRTRKEKTTPFGVNLMRSQVLYQAAQAKSQCEVAAVKHCAAMVQDGHRLPHTYEHVVTHNAQAGNVVVALAVMQ